MLIFSNNTKQRKGVLPKGLFRNWGTYLPFTQEYLEKRTFWLENQMVHAFLFGKLQ